MIIRNGKLVLPDRVVENGTVVIDEAQGRIEAVGPATGVRPARRGETVLDAQGGLITPGFIDLHCHGAWDADFMDGTREAFETVCAYHALHGVTSLLATSTSAETAVILQMLEKTRDAMVGGARGCRLLGAHLEGPWLNAEMKGCHLAGQVRLPLVAERRAFLEHELVIRLVTLSPEIEGAANAIRELCAAGIAVGAGHSTATYDVMMEAVQAGVRHVTHVFCAMSSTVRKGPWRHPGVLETALVVDRLTTDMIADGKHLPTPLMQLAYRCKGPDRLCLISDAMRAAGMPPGGQYTFGPRDGTAVVVADGVAMLPDMTAFASSITPLNVMVRNMVEAVGVPLHEAVRMASLTPARVIGVADRKGSLETGKDADICILDEHFHVQHTIIGGKALDRDALRALAPRNAVPIKL